MRFGSTAKALLKCKLKYYRISVWNARPTGRWVGQGWQDEDIIQLKAVAEELLDLLCEILCLLAGPC